MQTCTYTDCGTGCKTQDVFKLLKAFKKKYGRNPDPSNPEELQLIHAIGVARDRKKFMERR